VSFAAWEYKRGQVTATEAALIAAGRLEPPPLAVEVVGDRGEYVTVLVVSGQLSDRDALVYIEGRGLHEVAHIDPWADSGRFLVLRPVRRSG
jgi:uncharacterized protein YlxW (UPF0749 family)